MKKLGLTVSTLAIGLVASTAMAIGPTIAIVENPTGYIQGTNAIKNFFLYKGGIGVSACTNGAWLTGVKTSGTVNGGTNNWVIKSGKFLGSPGLESGNPKCFDGLKSVFSGYKTDMGTVSLMFNVYGQYRERGGKMQLLKVELTTKASGAEPGMRCSFSKDNKTVRCFSPTGKK